MVQSMALHQAQPSEFSSIMFHVNMASSRVDRHTEIRQLLLICFDFSMQFSIDRFMFTWSFPRRISTNSDPFAVAYDATGMLHRVNRSGALVFVYDARENFMYLQSEE